ncbi:hypothetical protein R5R35_007981 [Gryllus longicercus]|uniref:F-box domain-containing protein n=1 Tax=Gryllus longicercus TaxID=2509291 RepID=A0AAN9Z0N5_9ORTH|nr:Uncharacterized protein GBIM_04854 [Gryllus bimaculatus]
MGKHIEDLSEELLLEIFSYLSLNDVVFSIQFVNIRWRRISYDYELWKNRTYCPLAIESDEVVEKTLKMIPKLSNLVLDKRPYLSEVLETLVNNCLDIRRLEFNNYQMIPTKLLKKLVRQCPKIEFLHLPCRVLDSYDHSTAIGKLERLKTLKVGGWSALECPARLRPLADGCPSLEQIELVEIYCGIDDLQYLFLKKRESLRTITIRWCYDEGICVLPLLLVCTALKTLNVVCFYDIEADVGFSALKMLNNITSLSLLDFDNANIKDVISIFDNQNMVNLIELTIIHYENYENQLAKVIVNNCPNLKKLFINECNSMSDESIEDFYKLENLQYVELRSSAITDISVTCLNKCKKLIHLSLENCFLLSEEGMQNIIDFHNLQVLKLDSCDLKGLFWSQIPLKLKRLRYLSINFCQHVDENEVKQLKKEMPQLTVHFVADRFLV